METPSRNRIFAAGAALAAGATATAFVPNAPGLLRSSQEVQLGGGMSQVDALQQITLMSQSDARSIGGGIALAASVAGVVSLISHHRTSQKQCRATRTAVRSFEKELGATLPYNYWDPLGLGADGDEKAFRRRREAEIKNGRVAMIACIGWIVPEYYRWPGYCSPSQDLKFTDIPNGMLALKQMPADGWAQIGVFIAFCDLFFLRQEKDRAAGDFKNTGAWGVPFAKGMADADKKTRSLNSEINNGRLAMLAIAGMVVQSTINGGTTGPAMWFPSSAFESELGVQAPVGFFDPLGLAKDGDPAAFKRRRAAELKHGRICMLACVGYIIPEYFKWPGFISPSLGIKFADVPHGIGAISKVPIEGWLQIGLFIGHYEGFFMQQDPKREPGDFEKYGFLGIGDNFIFSFTPPALDSEARKKKLSAEIANGRLAMTAIMAMLFQNGTVGTAGPEMWLPSS